MISFRKKKFKICRDKYQFLKESIFEAIYYLLEMNDYNVGVFGQNVMEFKIYGSEITWIEPQFLLKAVFEKLETDQSSQKMITKHIKKLKQQFFAQCPESEAELKKRDPIEYQYNCYEFIVVGLIEAYHEFGTIDEDELYLVQEVLDKISNELMTVDIKKVA